MFASIAGRYDLLNRVLSLSLDRTWRRATLRAIEPRSGGKALDLCCGTGDLALELTSRGLDVVAADFCPEMLVQARRKSPSLQLVGADALALPFPDGSFDLVTIAFGLRNLADYAAGLREMRRVLRTGGQLAVLEFSVPPGAVFRRLYHFYLRGVVPAVGRGLSRRQGPYRYLSDSVQEFPDQARLAGLIEECGFGKARWINLSRGIAALHLATGA